ncbi:MAG TPA: hypothetical protein PK926_08370 [Spirochaetota bacterium]|nr:hypothetical protein [Spirochaetota bacterium]HPI89843.1 hypothetical protein [Spirochaetota bacterium]HPR48644.1 hypothetical protein [Spirochaetota bacterium]
MPAARQHRKISVPLMIMAVCLLVTVFFLRLLFSGETPDPNPIVINPGSPGGGAAESGWKAVMDTRQIYEWGRSRGLYLVEDRPPLQDGRAGFFSESGTSVTVRGLDPDRKYRLWIDFVTFIGTGDGTFFSPLTLTIKNLRTGKESSRQIRLREIEAFSLFTMNIPFEISAGSDIMIEFREDAPVYGGWGLWDMIISDRGQIPETIPVEPGERPEMKVRVGPVE